MPKPNSAAPIPPGAGNMVWISMPIGTSKAGAHQAAVDAEYQRQVAHSIAVGKAAGISPSDVGDWKGTVTFTIVVVKKKLDLTVDITSVTKNSATGTITIDGHTYSGTLTITYLGDWPMANVQVVSPPDLSMGHPPDHGQWMQAG